MSLPFVPGRAATAAASLFMQTRRDLGTQLAIQASGPRRSHGIGHRPLRPQARRGGRSPRAPIAPRRRRAGPGPSIGCHPTMTVSRRTVSRFHRGWSGTQRGFLGAISARTWPLAAVRFRSLPAVPSSHHSEIPCNSTHPRRGFCNVLAPGYDGLLRWDNVPWIVGRFLCNGAELGTVLGRIPHRAL